MFVDVPEDGPGNELMPFGRGVVSVVRDEEVRLAGLDHQRQWVNDVEAEWRDDLSNPAQIFRVGIPPHDLLAGRKHDDPDRKLLRVGQGA